MEIRHGARGIRPVDLSNIQLASSETARQINRDIVLEMIRAHQPISRADLSRLSGLQRSTVSQIAEQLIAEKWVCEGAVAEAPRGRRPTLLVLNENLVAIAIDIHPQQATVATIDLNGRLLSRSLVTLSSDPEASVRSMTGSIARMKHALSKKSVEGIGVSLPGRIEPRTQRLAFAPNLHWPEFDLKAAIEAKTGLSVKLENAATACLLAELTFGDLDGIRDIVLITVSEGVGTGVYANGLLIAGHGGMAGEFGHVPLDPAGPLCACGQRGCWETFASCNAALRYYREAQPEAGPLTYPQLLHLAEEGNLHAQSSLDKQAHALGRGLRMIVAGLAPSMILIAGDVTSAWRRFGPILDAEAAAWTLAGTPPKIVPTHEGEIARLRGAAALVFQRRSPRVLTMGGEGRSC